MELAWGKRMFNFHADETFEVDGVPAERQRTRCMDTGIDKIQFCSGAVYIPSLDVAFQAESSTNADEVDRILDRITVIPDQVGVPGFRYMAVDGQGPTGERYAAALRKLGLKAEIQTLKSPSYTPGQVIAVSPVPGTMLPTGAIVTLTVGAR